MWARRWALPFVLRAKGHTVSYGTRDPANSEERNAKPVAAALSGAEIVILATPWTATEALVCEHANELAGKIVIDATNQINPSLTRLGIAPDTSRGEVAPSQ